MPCGALAGGDVVFGVVGPKATTFIAGAEDFGGGVAAVLGADAAASFVSGDIAAETGSFT
jgi:hypothetical protein